MRNLRYVAVVFALWQILSGVLIQAQGTFNPVNITIYRDNDTLTLFVPEQGSVSLAGFAFRVDGEPYLLEDFPAFRGIPFDNVPTPICFRLARAGSSSPLPLECPPSLTLVQALSDGDVFWYDDVMVISITIVIQIGDATQGFCGAGQDTCDMSVIAPVLPTATPPDGPTPTATTPPLSPDCENDFNVPMTHIPKTLFFMGLSDDDIGDSSERPGRNVTLSAFCIDTYEVTNARYASCVNENACEPPKSDASQTRSDYYTSSIYSRFPVVNVTWEQAQTYCEYRGGRLPTEAEWELATRYDAENDDMRTFPWGNQTPDGSRANFSGKNIGDTVEVGQHPDGASAFGVHDLSGNVAEWVGDWFGPYDRQSRDNPAGPAEGTLRVIRGGSYADDAEQIRGGFRGSQSPNVESNKIGFRCVIS
jgi:formylglycine-generating enzyme required for sulfatase activity